MPECPVSVDCQGAHGAAGKFQDLDLFDKDILTDPKDLKQQSQAYLLLLVLQKIKP